MDLEVFTAAGDTWRSRGASAGLAEDDSHPRLCLQPLLLPPSRQRPFGPAIGPRGCSLVRRVAWARGVRRAPVSWDDGDLDWSYSALMGFARCALGAGGGARQHYMGMVRVLRG